MLPIQFKVNVHSAVVSKTYIAFKLQTLSNQ